jgi:spore maturation protein CgeB
MRVVVFCHSLISDWNHGNAHFLRGIGGELIARGHQVAFFEPEDAWSVQGLLAEQGDAPIARFHHAYPELFSTRYRLETLDLDEALDEADVVLVHEWNDPELVRRLGEQRRTGRFRLLFHDTHHRAATAPEEMAHYDLRDYDGVLAFGEVIRQLYLERGWARRAFTWHEAADARRFRPIQGTSHFSDVVWIGNWGDGERTAELREFLLGPVEALGLRGRVHGVRYPQEARAELAASGLELAGWIPNFVVPLAYALVGATVHIPRRPYARALPGIPTIRVFEALACGVPLVCAPWDDVEGLFSPGQDFLMARNGREMTRCLRFLLRDQDAAREQARRGRETILRRHTCGHRVDELFAVVAALGAPGRPSHEPSGAEVMT